MNTTSVVTNIKPELRAILTRCKVINKILVLPDEQVEKGLGEELLALIGEAGGVWGRKSGGYLFTDDPRKVFGLPMTELPGNVSTLTPEPDLSSSAMAIAMAAAILGEVSDQLVLDPYCGEGDISRACLKTQCSGLTVVDLDPNNLVPIRNLRTENTQAVISIYEADFFTINLRSGDFDRIVMRPPLLQDLKYVERAMRFLAPKGVLVAVLEPLVEQRGFLSLLHRFDHDLEKEAFPEVTILTIRNK